MVWTNLERHMDAHTNTHTMKCCCDEYVLLIASGIDDNPVRCPQNRTTNQILQALAVWLLTSDL